MKILKDESGQILAITVLGMFLLLACVALAVDVGMLFRAKRNAQIAADSAAIAGALAYEYPGGTNSPTAAADAAASANGVTNSNYVGVNTSPTGGYHTGAGYVEVKINEPIQTVLMGMWGFGTVNVGARAVAGTTPGAACLYVLDNTTGDSDVLYTKHTIQASNCGVQVNSPNTSATCDHGSGKVVATFLHIVGGQDTGGGCKLNTYTPVSTGSAPIGDPLKNLTGPIPATDCKPGNTYAGATLATASQLPAATANADGIASDAVTCFSASQVTLSDGLILGPGIYVFENGVNVGAITVNGGTLDVAGGYFNQKNVGLSITAPANKSAIYNGIAIMQPSINLTGGGHKCDTSAPCIQLQFGSGSENLNGIVYAPTSEVVMQDMGGSVTAAGIIAWQLGYVNTDLTITDSYNDANASTTPLSTVRLVE